MASILLVDGYNMIGNWAELVPLKATSLEGARDVLCSILSRYVSYRWDQVIVVFDAYRVPGRKQKPVGKAAFTVLYSGEGESADVVIERLTGEFVAAGHSVEVATSDALEQLLVLGKGATRISARELRVELMQIGGQLGEEYSFDVPTRQMLDTRLDEQTRVALEKLRRGR